MKQLFLILISVCFLLSSCREQDAPQLRQAKGNFWNKLTGNYFCEGWKETGYTESVHTDTDIISQVVNVKDRIGLNPTGAHYGLIHSLASRCLSTHQSGEDHDIETIHFFDNCARQGTSFHVNRLTFPAGQDSMFIRMDQQYVHGGTIKTSCRCGKINKGFRPLLSHSLRSA